MVLSDSLKILRIINTLLCYIHKYKFNNSRNSICYNNYVYKEIHKDIFMNKKPKDPCKKNACMIQSCLEGNAANKNDSTYYLI